MDPELQKLIARFNKTMAAAKADGAQPTTADQEGYLRQRSGGKYGLADVLQEPQAPAAPTAPASYDRFGEPRSAVQPGEEAAIGQFGKAVTRGASLGLSSLAETKAGRMKYNEWKSQHPIAAFAGNAVGSLAIPAIAPEAIAAVGATRLGQAGLGAVAAGVPAAAESEGSLKDRLLAGGKMAAAGGVLGMAVPAAVGAVRGLMRKVLPPNVASSAAPVVPPNVAQTMTDIERLAPGATRLGEMSKGMRVATRVLAADERTGVAAANETTTRLQGVRDRLGQVGQQYTNLLQGLRATPHLPSGANIGDVTGMNNVARDAHGGVSLEEVHALRSQIRERIRGMQQILVDPATGAETRIVAAGKSGSRMNDLRTDERALSDWLHQASNAVGNQPGALAALDRDYSTLARHRSNLQTLLKHIEQGRETYAASRVAGIEPGSPGAKLPANAKGFVGKLLSTDRRARARDAYRLLLEQGGVHPEVADAVNTLHHPPRPSGLLPFASGTGVGLLDRLLQP